MFNKKLDIALLFATAGLPLALLGVCLGCLLPVVQWLRDLLR